MAELKGKQLMVVTILNLLLLGALSYNALPEAYCELEDSTVKYVAISDTKKTVTKVLPSIDEDGTWEVIDDRCQKGTQIGEWKPVNTQTFKELNKPIVVGYVNNCENGEIDKYFCTGIGQEQKCKEEKELVMPFG